MGVIFHISKCFLFSFNILCMLLGIGVIAVNALGLKHALPGTEEHIFFIVGIILSSLVCMISLLGCYGVLCELLGVNIVYSIFILLLLFMQYLQMTNYPTHTFYFNAVQRLENSWRLVETQPYSMNMVEKTYHCCGLYDSRDYNHKGLRTPKSCYNENNQKNPTRLFTLGCLEVLHDFYRNVVHREKLCSWTLFGAECVVLVFSCFLSFLLYMRMRSQYAIIRREPVRDFIEQPPCSNHIDSRTALLQH